MRKSLSRKGGGYAGIIVGVLAVLLFGLLFYSTVTTDSEVDGGDEELPGGYELLSAHSLHLELANTTNMYSKIYNDTNISIDGLPLVEETELADKYTIEQGVFSGNKFIKQYAASNDSVGATLNFNVLDKEHDDELRVYVGGDKVYSGSPGRGEHVEVELTPDQLIAGKDNKIEVSVNSPGILFWRTNMYQLEGVYLDEKIFDYESAAENVSFSLGSDAIYGLVSAKLDADVSKQGDTESKKLFIDFNGENIYENTPGAVDSRVEIDVPLRGFSEDNTLTYRTELNGGYLISSVLELDVLNLTKASYEVWTKDMPDNVWPMVEKGQEDKEYECELYIKKTAGSDTVVVWINNNRQELAFDVDNKIELPVCGYLSEGKNTIILVAETSDTSSEDYVDIDEFSIKVREK